MSDSRKRVAGRSQSAPSASDPPSGELIATTAETPGPPKQVPTIPPAFWIGIPESPTGIRVRGTVIGRARTNMPADTQTGVVRQKVSYRIATDSVDLMVDDFAPPDFLPVGITVDLPVQVRAYMRRGNSAGYGMTVNRISNRGEDF